MPSTDIYDRSQIDVPPQLPDLLKDFTKAAIRTQPPDVLAWSASYFRALSSNRPLPIKKRLEAGNKTGTLTTGLLELIYNQFEGQNAIETSMIKRVWTEIGLLESELREIFDEIEYVESDYEAVDVFHFIAIGASHIANSNITDSMKVVCQVMRINSQNRSNEMDFETFKIIYGYLAARDGEITQETVDEVLTKLQTKIEGGCISPRHFLGPDSPKLS